MSDMKKPAKESQNEFEQSKQKIYGNQSNIHVNGNGSGCSSVFAELINKTKIILSGFVLVLAFAVIVLIALSPPGVIAFIATVLAILLVTVIIVIFWWLARDAKKQ